MTTLITGGTGLIGSTLADKLLTRGENVVVFDAAPAEARLAPLRAHGDRLAVIRGDVQALGELVDSVRRHRVTAIVHLAFLLGGEANLVPERATRINMLGTVNALEAARLTGVERVLLASSISVYGSDDQYAKDLFPLREDVPLWVCRTLPIYGGGKLRRRSVQRPGRAAGAAGPLKHAVRRPMESGPILGREARDTCEVPSIVGDERQPQRQRMSRHEGVERADSLAAPRQCCCDHGKSTGSGLIEGHNLDGLHERGDQAVKSLRATCFSAVA